MFKKKPCYYLINYIYNNKYQNIKKIIKYINI